jgi:hypothetical protein
MKPEDNKPANKLDADLSSVEQVYRGSEPLEPPDMLDQAVLNKARLAAERRRSGWHFGGFRWVSAFATASVVVVSLALVMEQAVRPPGGPQLNGTQPSRSESYEVDFIQDTDTNELSNSAGEEASSRQREAEQLRLEQSSTQEQKMDFRAAAKPAARRNETDRRAVAPAAAPAIEPAEEQFRDDAAQAAGEPARRQGFMADNMDSLDKSVSDTDTAVSEAGLKEGVSSNLSIAAEPVLEAELDEVAVYGNAIKAELLPPDEWIRQIMRWKHMQLNDRFEREFAEFREVYPDYELPDELARIVREREAGND